MATAEVFLIVIIHACVGPVMYIYMYIVEMTLISLRQTYSSAFDSRLLFGHGTDLNCCLYRQIIIINA